MFMQDKQFVLNTDSRTLHKVNGCYYSNVWSGIAKYYDSEDEVIAEETRYFKCCKNCFKNK